MGRRWDAVRNKFDGRPEPPKERIWAAQIGRVAEFPIEPCVVWGAAGPFFGAVICLFISWTHQYSIVTGETLPPHCGSNTSHAVPSLSMAIGVYKPNKFIWLFFVVLHFLPRPFLGMLYNILYASTTAEARHWRIYRAYNWLLVFHYHLGMVGILILSIIDFESSFRLHCFGFVIWIYCSCFVMTANTGLHHFSGWRNVSLRNEIMLWVKLVTTIIQLTFSFAIIYIYPVVYIRDCRVFGHTLFSVMEYTLLFLDICYCFFPLIEFPGVRLGMYVDYSAVFTYGTYRTHKSHAALQTSIHKAPSALYA